MSHDGKPNWQPLNMLPVITKIIDGELADAVEHFACLEEARSKPHVLDDETLTRSIKLHTDQFEFTEVFKEQLERWRMVDPTPEQRKEIERLVIELKKLQTMLTKILALAAELSSGTIDRILAKPAPQLGIEALERRGIKVDDNLTAEQVYAVIDEVRKEQFGDNTKPFGGSMIKEKHLKKAALIDARMRKLEAVGKNNMEILTEMADLMPDFMTLIKTAGSHGMDELCARFGGFYRYAQILEYLAAGVVSGDIEVPK